ncbi:PTS fructose transporter subunit IIABC [Caviibacter abscessus]|uniref:PTS fructose transporter subunit IIABC n=1 Tax=Caviibacter abscessus TaxID=1766719 RepID=UPI0008389E11|nr:fructose-specific PTS transporter subunit EIIC [Caviibacter abscessus]
MKISEILSKNRIITSLEANTKEEAINEMAFVLQEEGILNDYALFVEDVLKREEQASTALDDGIVTPHAKSEYVNSFAIVMGISRKGIDVQADDGKLGKIFFLIAAPKNSANEHIDALQSLSQIVLEEGNIEKILSIHNEEQLLKFIESVENKEEKTENDNMSDKYIVAVTACPTGIAHTYMAAEALEKAAKELGVTIKVEKNGTAGRENELSKSEIEKAYGVILAVNKAVDEGRFYGKKIIKVGAKDAINHAKQLILDILDGKGTISSVVDDKKQEVQGQGIYKHLLNGVSYMLPLVISGGILIALAFLFDSLSGYSNVGYEFGSKSQLAKIFMNIGKAAFGLFVPVLAGFIAYSISDKAALAAGLVAGSIASSGGSGFLGAIIGGILAAYVIKLLEKIFKDLPKSLNGMKLILIYPVLSVLITGVLMIILLNPVVSQINASLNNFLLNLSSSSRIILGIVLGAMMALDMGGPVNKAAYVFGTGTLAAGIGSSAMAAVMAGGMVPPLAIALATTLLFRNKYSKEEREAGVSNYIMGLSFITEGAIPFAASNPGKVIPATTIGAAIAGALTMFFKITIPAPHGGILVMFLSNNFLLYLLSILIGSFVGAICLGLLKNK